VHFEVYHAGYYTCYPENNNSSIDISYSCHPVRSKYHADEFVNNSVFDLQSNDSWQSLGDLTIVTGPLSNNYKPSSQVEIDLLFAHQFSYLQFEKIAQETTIKKILFPRYLKDKERMKILAQSKNILIHDLQKDGAILTSL